MIAKIQKWGNSQGLRIPKEALSVAHFVTGDALEIEAVEGCIVLKPTKKIQKKYRIQDLFKNASKKNPAKELNWGKATGKEVW